MNTRTIFWVFNSEPYEGEFKSQYFESVLMAKAEVQRRKAEDRDVEMGYSIPQYREVELILDPGITKMESPHVYSEGNKTKEK
jgi:hypothetical protein